MLHWLKLRLCLNSRSVCRSLLPTSHCLCQNHAQKLYGGSVYIRKLEIAEMIDGISTRSAHSIDSWKARHESGPADIFCLKRKQFFFVYTYIYRNFFYLCIHTFFLSNYTLSCMSTIWVFIQTIIFVYTFIGVFIHTRVYFSEKHVLAWWLAHSF